MFKLLNTSEWTEEYIIQSSKMEDNRLPLESITNTEKVLEWFRYNPMTHIGVVDTNVDKIAGCITLLPLHPDKYAQIKAGLIDDTMIETSDFYDWRSAGSCPLWFSCICLNSRYEVIDSYKIIKLLYKGFFKLLTELARENIWITEIAAEAATEEGEKLCNTYMHKIRVNKFGSKIYRVSLLPLNLNVHGKYAVEFCTLYKKQGGVVLDGKLNLNV